jgi:hypothetical protein
MKTVPEGLESIGIIMSNFDHEIEPGAEDRLKTTDVFGEYSAWNFFGFVWFDKTKKQFLCMIEQYRTHVATLVAESLTEIMDIASARYGAK